MIAVVPWVAQTAPQAPNPIMLPALAGVALMVAVLGIVFPDMQLARGLAARLKGRIVERPNPAAEVTFREAAPPIKEFDDVHATWTATFMIWQTAFIMKMALAESVGLFGVVVTMTGFPKLYGIPFTVLALILQLARFPTAATIQRAVEKATGVPLPLP